MHIDKLIKKLQKNLPSEVKACKTNEVNKLAAINQNKPWKNTDISKPFLKRIRWLPDFDL